MILLARDKTGNVVSRMEDLTFDEAMKIAVDWAAVGVMQTLLRVELLPESKEGSACR